MQFLPFIFAAIGWLLIAWIGNFSHLAFNIGLIYIITSGYITYWLDHQDDSLAKPTRQQLKWQDRAFLCTAPCLLLALVVGFMLYCLIVYFFRVLYWTLWKGALWSGNKEAAAVYHQALRQSTNIFDEPEPPLIVRD